MLLAAFFLIFITLFSFSPHTKKCQTRKRNKEEENFLFFLLFSACSAAPSTGGARALSALPVVVAVAYLKRKLKNLLLIRSAQ